MKTLPFVGQPSQRNTGTLDSRYVNVLFESIPNDALKVQTVYCTKRPGTSVSSNPAGASTGRGIHAWAATQKVYSVAGHAIYSNTSLVTTMNTSSGRVWFQEIPQTTGNRILVISDGQDNYNISTNDGVTTVDQTNNTNYPVSNLGPVNYIDGFMVQYTSSYIWHFSPNSISSNALDAFKAMDTDGSPIECGHLIKNQIIAWSKNRTGFFFNNSNPIGSVFLKISGNTLGVGMASKATFAYSGESCCWVGENSGDGDGGRAVYMIQSLTRAKSISTPVINRFLSEEGLSISSASAWMEKMSGQVVYCLNLRASNRTFVYHVDTGLWAEWQSSSGARVPFVSATSLNGVMYLQGESDGNIYLVSTNIFRDNGSDFTVTLQTPFSQFGNPMRKQEKALSIVGDSTVSTLEIYVNDDGGTTTYTKVGDIDMTNPQKRITRLGGFYERSHQFRYAANSSLRLQAWTPEF